jgi:putative hemolysin
MLLFQMNGVFKGNTLNDILEALVGDASDFYKDDFQLIERRWQLVG